MFVATVLSITGFYLAQPESRELVLNIYFLPIVVAGVLLGWLRASGLALLGTSLVLTICWMESANVLQSIRESMVILVWGAALSATGGFIGYIVAERDAIYSRLLAKESELAIIDPLTEIPNRRAFEFELERLLRCYEQRQQPFVLLLIDIDRFKGFNDQYGHDAGDRALREVATTISETVPEADLAARFGGEEFAVLLSNVSDSDGEAAAERIRAAVESASVEVDKTLVTVTVSVGGTSVWHGDSRSDVLNRADVSLYGAKNESRNRVEYARVQRGSSLAGSSRSESDNEPLATSPC